MASIKFLSYYDSFDVYQSYFIKHLDYNRYPIHLCSIQNFGKRDQLSDLHPNWNSYYMAWMSNTYVQDQNHHASCYAIKVNNVQENTWGMSFMVYSFDMFLDYVDLCTGPYEPEQVPAPYNNYLRIPVYVTKLLTDIGLPTFNQVCDYIDNIEYMRKQNPFKRELISALIARHNGILLDFGVREILYDVFSEIFPQQQVYCPGNFLHNCDDLHQKFNNDKVAFLKHFVFNLCPENSYAPGYVTEKILDSYLAGCVPIYWGSMAYDDDIFNTKAYIYFDPRDTEKFKTQVLDIFHNEQSQQEFLNQKVFKPGAAARIFLRFIYPTFKRLQALLNLNPYLLSKDPISVQANLEEQANLARKFLANLGLEPETMYDYLDFSQNSRYMFPFTSSQKALFQKRKPTRYLQINHTNKRHLDLTYTFASEYYQIAYVDTIPKLNEISADKIVRI